jgi:hypothetical protein
MLFAAKSMALAGWDLFTQPELLAQAQSEFEAAKKGKTYISPLPEGAKPQ